jgi:hypothetical protein
MFYLPSGAVPHVQFSLLGRKKPPGTMAWVGLCATRKDLLRFAHTHTLTSQQQQQVRVAFCIIVMNRQIFRTAAGAASIKLFDLNCGLSKP